MPHAGCQSGDPATSAVSPVIRSERKCLSLPLASPPHELAQGPLAKSAFPPAMLHKCPEWIRGQLTSVNSESNRYPTVTPFLGARRAVNDTSVSPE
jgi:hypothetical protein